MVIVFEDVTRGNDYLRYKGVRALRGYFGSLLSQKLKIAFHQFLLIGSLEE